MPERGMRGYTGPAREPSFIIMSLSLAAKLRLNNRNTAIVLLWLELIKYFKLLGQAEASPTLITHTRKSLYLCMYVCMYVQCMYVCMYVAIRRPRVHHALCACARAYHNSVKIVNVDRMLTLIVAHPAGELNSQRIRARERLGKQPFER